MDIDRIRGVIAQMKLSEKLALACGGVDIPSAERLKVPSASLSDELLPYSAKEPSTLALGCSFSHGICSAISRTRSTDAARSKKAFAGAIGCGLIRDPMRADAAECFSEDPFLTAELLTSYASAGVIGYVFTGTLGQGTFNARTIDGRALHELYLYPLRKAGEYAAAVQLDGGYLNGNKVCSSRAVADIISAYIGREAMLITQYGEGCGTEGIAGNGAYQFGADNADKKAIARAIVDGEIIENKLNYSIERTLMTVAKTHEFYKKPFDRSAPETATVYDTSVLLKNKKVIPAKEHDIVLFGDPSRFDDGKAYTVYPLRDATKKAGKINVFILSDYEGGIDGETVSVIEAVSKTAKTVVVLCGTCAVPLPFESKASAILFCPYSPNIYSLMTMLTSVSPRGHLPFTWCENADCYPVNNKKYAERGDFRYESMFNGYMLFNNFSSKVLYPFGHGLGYTDYEITKFALTCNGLKLTADFIIKNTGDHAGTAVCQLYLSFTGDGVYGITKRLAAFKRVPLEVTENSRVSMEIDLNDFAVYSDSGSFTAVGGRYAVELGLSSRDIRAGGEIKVPVGSRVNAGSTKELLPSYYNVRNVVKPFAPTAPEIERLLKVPFIKKPDEYPDLLPPPASEIKKTIKKLSKSTPPRQIAIVKYKAEHTPLNRRKS